jgi:hypothetical protein
MDGEGSDKEKDLRSGEAKEDREEELSKESTFFLNKKEIREAEGKEGGKEGKPNKDRDRSAAFFIPGADAEIKEG